jgi:anaerobic ribonucleoside-triphosphate reductase activating protein
VSTSLRVHAVLPRSRANGPGTRFTLWTQGCSLGCAGCFNPETHDAGGEAAGWREVAQLAEEVLADTADLEGLTLTGGEPLEQPEAVAALCAAVKERSGLGIVILTGFSRAEIEADPGRRAAVARADMVVAGRYNARLHLGRGLRGSSNKTYWALTDRYRAADFSEVPEMEIVVAPDGTLTVTGMEAPRGALG